MIDHSCIRILAKLFWCILVLQDLMWAKETFAVTLQISRSQVVKIRDIVLADPLNLSAMSCSNSNVSALKQLTPLLQRLSSLLRSGSIVGSFVRTVWPALWHQLTVSTQTAYACRRCFQDLDTGSKRLEALSQSISKLEGSFLSSEYYPLAVRTTTIFTQPFDSYPRSLVTLAMTLCKVPPLCIRSGSTVSSISAVRNARACDRHVICSLLFTYLQSDWSPRITGLRQENAHSPQTHLQHLLKWQPEVGMGTRLP